MAQILKMDEYLDLFYNPKRASERAKLPARLGRFVAKADQLTTTDTDTKNTVFGAEVMSWLNYQSEIWQILPKRPAPQNTGFRVLAGEPISGVSAATGLQETVEFPATATIASFVNVEWDPKWMGRTFGISEQDLWRATRDDNVDEWAVMRDQFALGHVREIDNLLGRRITNGPNARLSKTSGGTYVIESLARMISSSAEATTLTTTADANIYYYGVNLRRSGFSGAGFGNGPFDSIVDEAAGTLRSLTLDLLDGVIRAVRLNGADTANLYMLTGQDTADAISNLLQARQRFLNTTRIVNTLNGVQRVSDVGVAGGVDVMSYKGIPIFTSRAIESYQKPSGGLTPIYGVYQPDFYIAVAMPTLYLETGQDDWLLLDKMRRKAAYVTAAELIGTRFNRSYKIVDLSA